VPSTQILLALASRAWRGADEATDPLLVMRGAAAVVGDGRRSDTGFPSSRNPPGL
jgi:hypothetical protein